MFRRRKQREHDLDRELRSHLELEAEEQRARGLAPEDAGRAAHRALGNAAAVQEATRDAWGWTWLDRLFQDLRYGCRAFQKSPGFAAVAILTAALGIGANTAIFSVVYTVLLRPLPYRDAGRLVMPQNVIKDGFFLGPVIADFQYTAWREGAAGVFESLTAYRGLQFTLTGLGEPEQLDARSVTPGFLRTLGVAPFLGRDFTPADTAPARRIALLTYSFWMRKFRGDRSVVSRQITLNGVAYSVIGVMPRDFEFPGAPKVSLMVGLREVATQTNGAVYFYSVLARLKRGVTKQRAADDLGLINRRLDFRYARRLGRTPPEVAVIGLHDQLVGDVRPALLALAGAVGLVLLIACVNISNLLLARAIARRKEIAVRIALGAGRMRVTRQLLTEGLLLAASGGAAGLALAFGCVKLLQAIAPAGVPHIQDAGINTTVLAFNAFVALASGLLFGFAPMRGFSKIDPESALKQAGRSASASAQHRRLENLLIVAETAFALILLAGAGLLLRTFAGLTAISPGFRPDNVITARVSLPYWKYSKTPQQTAVMNAALARARTAPGVEAAGLVACLPYGSFLMTGLLEVEGKPATDPKTATEADSAAVNFASGDYFRAMGIPLREGRAIDGSDADGRPRVVVVNEALVRRFFPGGGALGSHIRLHGVDGNSWSEIVGIARDQKQSGLASAPRPEMWVPAAQSESGGSATAVVIRSKADPRVLGPWLKSQVAEVDPDLPAPEIETMRAKIATLLASQVFVLRLLSAFAAIAVALAAIGIYSVLVYSVQRRSHEIGIRLALGAKRADIVGLVLGRGLRLSLAGSLIGLAGALALTRYLKSLLYGVTPHDPATLAVGSVVVVFVALAAAWLPARRAMKQDPTVTLRAE